jgi:hypothetical protein
LPLLLSLSAPLDRITRLPIHQDANKDGHISFEEFKLFVKKYAAENTTGEWDKGAKTLWKESELPELGSAPNHLALTNAQVHEA